MKSCFPLSVPIQVNQSYEILLQDLKFLDLSYKMDLDFWNYFGSNAFGTTLEAMKTLS